MDDLLGEDWQKPPPPKTAAFPPPSTSFNSNFNSNTFRASPQLPISGTASPANISRPSSTVNGSSKPATPSNGDAFGSLLSSKSGKAGATGVPMNVSLQERQRLLLEEKRRQQEQQSQLWEGLGSGRSTPGVVRGGSPATVGQFKQPGAGEEEDDILAAFNKEAPVDRASNFSPPVVSARGSGVSTPAFGQVGGGQGGGLGEDEDDDLFGLGGGGGAKGSDNGQSVTPVIANGQQEEDDDILGDLGRPVSARPPPPPAQPTIARESSSNSEAENVEAPPKDRALADLVDMGFPADTAQIALAETGGNVQDAVGWLLQQAHEESRQKARGETSTSRTRNPNVSSRSPHRRQRDDGEAMPAWMRSQDNSRPSSTSRQREANGGEKDPGKMAQEIGSKMWKSANSLWKASQKQMQKTIAELQQDTSSGNPNQPKWMRDASADSDMPRRRPQEPRSAHTTRTADVTDEAAALDAPRERPPKPPRPSERPSQLPERGRSPAEALPQRQAAQPRFMNQTPAQPDRRPAAKLSRQDVEEQSAQAYVSPARRKRQTPQPPSEPASTQPEIDLFETAAPPPSSRPRPSDPPSRPAQPSKPKTTPASTTPRPKARPRNIPPISPSALQASAKHRKAGGEHFKRGDYAAAHESYTAALTPLPSTHPITIIVLSNRSLTALKTGDAKVAVADADRALEIIGTSQGVDEKIDLGGGEGQKDMKEFFGKALMRKAEALEHMEKYSDAAAVWRQAVQAGVGGAVALKGRERCERAATPKPPTAAATPKAAPKRTPAAPATKGLGTSLTRPTIPSPASAEAVKKLRAANATASAEEDEKFALADTVDAKLSAWKGGKGDNLRALLQSMDVVLGEGSGWKKVGMGDLVMPGKVKVVYMKAIGKVHPDKVPQDATTEQKMVSAAVFSTLNEAWDKFRVENGL